MLNSPNGQTPRIAPLRCYLADLRHFRLVDVSVLVHVKQREGPLQFPGGLPGGGHVQRNDVLLEVQRAVVVGVEGAEDVPRVALGVAVGEEAGVDLLELLGRDAPGRTLLLEVLVPLADLALCEFGAELQVVQDLLRHGAARGIPHCGWLFFSVLVQFRREKLTQPSVFAAT